jgi:1-deoxy-D-xylulose-5-phosphate synthase
MRIGLPDRYVTHGKPALLREEAGLTGASVADRVLAALRSGEPALS